MISVKKSGKNIQPELRQKFVDGYQKHVVEVQLANGFNQILIEKMCTFEPVWIRDLCCTIIHDITMAFIPIIIFCEACVAHVCN